MTDQELLDLIYNRVLIVVHDGGKFAPYFHPNYNMASRHQVDGCVPAGARLGEVDKAAAEPAAPEQDKED